jgi:hypothetical protein
MSDDEIRAVLRRAFGAYKYRITRGGEIHVYGEMPNSVVVGWYLYGSKDDAQTIDRIEALL